MSFNVKGGAEAAHRVFDRLQRIWRATDLGRIKSVATIPAISTHQQQGEEGRKLAGIPQNLIRLCVGGEHPDDWHRAHFTNPRHTSPASIMPSFSFHSQAQMGDLTRYVQGLGGTDADFRVARQERWKRPAVAAYEGSPDSNVAWIHSKVPEVWRKMPNPYPATEASLARGQRVYELYCVGCHGPSGDGRGAAQPYLNPPPLNFALLRRNLIDGKYIGGLLYYQIMNGITGTAMPYFKTQLESAKIWDVSNYVAYNFIGWEDTPYRSDQIDAAYKNAEPPPPKDFVQDQP